MRQIGDQQSGIDTSQGKAGNQATKIAAVQEPSMTDGIESENSRQQEEDGIATNGGTGAVDTPYANSSIPAGDQGERFVEAQINDGQSNPPEGINYEHRSKCYFFYLGLLLISLDHNAEANGTSAESSHGAQTVATPNFATSRERSDIMLSTVSSIPGPQGQARMSSMFFVVQALETIQSTKEGKRKSPLTDAIAKALGTRSNSLFIYEQIQLKHNPLLSLLQR